MLSPAGCPTSRFWDAGIVPGAIAAFDWRNFRHFHYRTDRRTAAKPPG
jgi:hypothetical protein